MCVCVCSIFLRHQKSPIHWDQPIVNSSSLILHKFYIFIRITYISISTTLLEVFLVCRSLRTGFFCWCKNYFIYKYTMSSSSSSLSQYSFHSFSHHPSQNRPSLLAGSLDCIKCPYRTDKCRSFLVGQHW